MKDFIKQYYRRLFVLTAACFLIACSYSGTKKIMPLDMDNSGRKTPYVVNVRTEMDCGVSNADFRFVLGEAIIKSQLFKGVIIGQGNADYLLTVNIKSSRYVPSFGGGKAEVEAVWTLERLKDKKIVFKKAILSTNAKDNEFCCGGKMDPIAIAARGNIRQGLTDIANSQW